MEIKYKDLSNSKIIGLDIETYDPGLNKKIDLGPGVYRKDGFVLGFSLADESGFEEYYNLKHYDCNKLEHEKNIAYLKQVCSLNIPKVGANIQYDIDWIENYLNIKVNGQLYDIQIAEALLNEEKKHLDLDTLAFEYLHERKRADTPKKFCEENNLSGDFRQWLYKMPYALVREYGQGDASQPIKILKRQWALLYTENLLNVFHLECDLIRVLLLMRKTGVKIDPETRDRNALKTANDLYLIKQELFKQYGEFNFNSSQQLAKIFDREKINYPMTEKGNPSITTGTLKSLINDENKIAEKIYNCKKADKILNTFLLGSLNKFPTENNLIHASYYNTKIEQDFNSGLKGTRSGRLSMSHPNLQQIPSKGANEHWGQTCREIFIPFENCYWGKLDWSQIEYRFMAHFATGNGADKVRQAYRLNKDTDYHQYIIDLTGLKRRFAKNLNFGVAYGMGANKMALFFAWSLEYCHSVLEQYHKAAPFIRSTINAVERTAKQNGYIRTFLGRKSRLFNPDKVYTMFCRLIQGSAADLMKKAMLDIYNASIFEIVYPHITVHDELDVSIPKTKIGLEAFNEMHFIMENCIDIKVPIKAEPEIGNNWADLKEYDINNYEEYLK